MSVEEAPVGRQFDPDQGATVVEYGLVAGLVSLVIAVALVVLGDAVAAGLSTVIGTIAW